LASVIIPSGINTIWDDAFAFCPNLFSVTIPASATSIGYGLFADSSNLTSVYFQGNAPAIVGFPIDSPAFYGDSGATVYYLPGTMGWSNTYQGVPAVLWNPQIQASGANFGMKNNQFGFNITGTPNIPIEVQASTGLPSSVWTTLTNVSLTNGSYYFSEPIETCPGRYYRISPP